MRRIYKPALPTVVWCLILLTGCSGNIENVEQRDYATLMMISQSATGTGYHYVLGIAKEHHVGEKGEAEDVFETDAMNLDELVGIYSEHKGKELSLSHLKVILTAVNNGRGIQNGGENRNSVSMFVELLYELDAEDEIAKTCPMLLVMDSGSIVEYLRSADRPVGTYISDLVRTAKRNDMKIPGLMNYLKMLREGSSLDIYSIENKGEDMVLHFRMSYEQ